MEYTSSDVHKIKLENKEIILIGTAHVSQQSADLVKNIIEEERPDCVCVELDEQRYKALAEKKKWQNLDLRQVIKNKQLTTLLINILLASYQKKMGEKLGVQPGVELLAATETAKELNIPIKLCDREIRTTLRRAWNSMSFKQKMKLLFSGMFGIFDKQELTEEKLAEIRKKDALNEMMNELGQAMPVLKRVLVDERDIYLAQKISETEGNKIVAVVGAGHINGIKEIMQSGKKRDLKEIEIIPPPSKIIKWIGWGIPILIIGSILIIGWQQGFGAAKDNAIFWFLANGIPSGLGAAIAFGHPLTILSAFFGAPFTSLTPVIGAGYVAAFVQYYFKPPLVKEFETVRDDIRKFTKWWSNKLLRIFLVFLLSGIGSAIGTYIGAYEIISNLFN